MANRNFRQFLFSHNAGLTFIEGSCAIGALGAVSEVKGSGVKNVVRISAGVFDIELEDTFARLLALQASMQAASGAFSGVHAIELEGDPQATVAVLGAAKVRIHAIDGTGVAADPASGSKMYFNLMLRNSSVKGKGE